MSENTELGSAVLFLVILVSTDLCAVQSPESGNYIEVPPGTQLCDPAEDVYGFYLVKKARALLRFYPRGPMLAVKAFYSKEYQHLENLRQEISDAISVTI
jgi:hypothetical protein